MATDTFTLAAVADVLGIVTSRHATAIDSDGAWLDLPAGLHSAEASDAARDLLDMLAARGFSLHRATTCTDGNSLGARLARLALVAAQNGNPSIAAALDTLATEAEERDDAAIPAHLRMSPATLPPGVVALDQRRRALA